MKRPRAFVSSTRFDLREHPHHVLEQLAQARFDVEAMEHWSAGPEEPKQVSVERIEGCDVLVLLVAWRRGHVPAEGGRSITQLEYDCARAKGIEVLAFLLDEKQPWFHEFDERRDDTEVER